MILEVVKHEDTTSLRFQNKSTDGNRKLTVGSRPEPPIRIGESPNNLFHRLEAEEQLTGDRVAGRDGDGHVIRGASILIDEDRGDTVPNA
jgi:hypothetical protein